ncbi:hypothetical protein Taro_043021 [Colocasia esculenta]|uniref:Uncharacterized protein n=1 Tax=Colocasia esculenta TaxID=4460 RepID=A0A843WXZ7_COLES|nr:hypothetical protein [Colocasia esculenta]
MSPCCWGVSLLDVPFLLGCVLVGCPLVVGMCVVLAACLALCACAPLCAVLCSVGVFARAKQMLVCRVALLVERCDTCLWLLPALCWLVLNSGASLGCGVLVVFPRTVCCCPSEGSSPSGIAFVLVKVFRYVASLSAWALSVECRALGRVSGRGAGQVVFMFVLSFPDCTGGTSCVPSIERFASFIAPCMLCQMVVW